jgi:Flp pilus assembly pilin Flp
MAVTRTGTFSIEYAALIVILAAALLSMALYLKRSLSGRWRAVGDTFGFGRQYAPQ